MYFKLTRKALSLCFVVAAILVGGLVTAVTGGTGDFTVYQAYSDGQSIYMGEADAVDASFELINKQKATGATTGCQAYPLYQGYNVYTSTYTAQWTNGVMARNCAPANQFLTQYLLSKVVCTSTTLDWRCNAKQGPATEVNAGVISSCPKKEEDLSPLRDPKPMGSCHAGNPINVGTANKFQAERDFTTPGSPYLYFERYYNSQYAIAPGGSMGHRWHHSFEYKLTKPVSGGFALMRPDGAIKTFGAAGGDPKISIGVVDYVFDALGNVTGYVFDNFSGVKERYDVNGRLTRIDFLSGEFLNFTYNATSKLTQVSDNFGRAISFAYDTNNLLTQVTAPSGGGVHLRVPDQQRHQFCGYYHAYSARQSHKDLCV